MPLTDSIFIDSNQLAKKFPQYSFFEDYPIPAKPVKRKLSEDREFRAIPNAGTQTINGQTVNVATVEKWAYPVLGGGEPSRERYVGVNDQVPGRIVRIYSGYAGSLGEYDLSLTEYTITPP